MSKEKKENATTEKVMTKYDRKMEKRRQEEAQAAKAAKTNRIVSIIVLLAIVALVVGSIAASMIRKQRVLNDTYIKIGEHEITKLEYDFYFNTVVNDTVNSYSYMMAYIGLDTTKDFADQPYFGDENMTWKDYFDQATVARITETKAVCDDAAAKGFVYDVTEDYAAVIAQIKVSAASSNMTIPKYYKEAYGDYASEKRLENIVKENLLCQAYYAQLATDNTPSQEEIDAYYTANKTYYDTVDYRSFAFSAEGITETSTEEEKAAALAAAKKDAESFLERVKAGEDFNALCAEFSEDVSIKAFYQDTTIDYSLVKGADYSSVSYAYSGWLYDEARVAKDADIVEDASGSTYYVVVFEGRNKEEATVNLTISDTLATQAADEYVDALTQNYSVTDVAGQLTYLTMQAEEATESATQTETTQEAATAQ